MTKLTGLFFKILMATILVLSVFTPAIASAYSGYGAGTSTNPYRIATCAQLQEIDSNATAYYTLVSNIDCTGVTFTSLTPSPAAFSGTLDGLNHTISNLTTNNDSGLFSQTNGATIKNINIASGTASSNGNLGSFVGCARASTLDNVHSSMTVASLSGSAYVGGLVGGSVEGTTINGASYSGTISGGSYIGGLVGYQGTLTPAGGSLSNSYFDGTMNVAGTYVGGAVGILYSGAVDNIYSSGSINVTGATTYLGGLIGITYKGATNNSFAASYINGTGTQFGAVFGIFFGAASDFSSTRSNLYFDRYRSNGNDAHSLGCASTDQGTGTCAEVNTANATPLYFKSNSTNAPLNNVSWDFANTWSVTSGYPALRNLQLFNAPTGIPNNGDANGDSIQDSYQANVMSVQDSNGVWATVTVPTASACTLGNGTTTSPTASDTGYTSLTSLTSFWVYCPTPGSTVAVTIIYDKQYTSPTLRYYNASTGTYTAVPGVTYGTKTIGGIVKTTATYNLTDGGSLDSDGTANGIIKDPVGLASLVVVAPATGFGAPQGTSSRIAAAYGLMSLCLFAAAAALRRYSHSWRLHKG